MTSALIVFAKVPMAGRVKTRLTPELDEQEAAELYEAFLLDALDAYSALDADMRLYVAGGAAQLGALQVPQKVAIFQQSGDGLGERMARAFAETFAGGYERVTIIGTDHPTLPPAFIDYAFRSLSSPKSITIGPADDGGYYLLAMNDFMPQVFRGMSYSHPGVFEETLMRIADLGADLVVLPPWYDVDRPAQLRRLRAELAENETLAPRTKHHIDLLARRHAWLHD